MKSTKKVITDWENVPLYMDLPYVSMLFGFSVDCLKKKAQSGILPAAKMFGEWRISKEDAKAYFEKAYNETQEGIKKMEVIINKSKSYSFKEVEIGDVFSDDLGRFMMKVSYETAICLDDNMVYGINSNTKCYLRDCVIIERELLENLKKGANGYE